MKRILIITIALTIANLFAYNPSFLRQPALSPDGETICFNYMSDLWIVPYQGGVAKRITVSEGDDTSPIYSPDGKWIAFGSNRDGRWSNYIMPAEGGAAIKISEDTYQPVRDWFKDGQRLLSIKFKMGTGSGQYITYLDGRRTREIAPITHHFSKLSPDENKIIFVRRGDPFRPAYSGSISGDLWEYDINSKTYTQLTFTETTERYPLYSNNNPHIYYGASDGERFQLFRVENYDFENRKQLTFFDQWSVRNIAIARHNDRLVFERFDKLWRYNPEIGKTEEVEVVIKQDFLGDFQVKETFTNVADNFSISPNGKLLAYSYRYDLFAMPEKGGEVRQLTFDQKGISDIVILPDNRTIYFLKRDKGSYGLFSVDIQKPERIVKTRWSEGKYINRIYMVNDSHLAIHYKFDEDNWKVALMNINNKRIKEIIEDHQVWSWFLSFSDKKDYAFFVSGVPRYWARNLFLYDIRKKNSTRLFSRLNYIGNLYLGKDQQSLFMTLENELVRLDLQAKPDFYKITDDWEDVLETKSKPRRWFRWFRRDKKPSFSIEVEDIETRIKPISRRQGINYVVHVLSDSTLYYVNRRGNSYSLRMIDYWGENDQEIVSFSGHINRYTTAFQYNKENNNFYVVIDNSLRKIDLEEKKVVTIGNQFDYEYNELELNRSVFDEIWVEFGNNFYDRNMHNRDWDEMYRRFRPYVDYTYRMEYFGSIIDEMIGELNASHTGFSPRRDEEGARYDIALMGFTLDYSTHLDKGIRIRSIYQGSTPYIRYGIREGDILLSVDDIEIEPLTPIGPLFEDKVGKEINLKIETPEGIKELSVKGLTPQERYDLYYEDLIAGRRDLVHQLSDDRIGYLHIPQMRQDRVQPFLDDLFARYYDKEAVIIDVRGNSGGRLTEQLLDILTRQPRAYTTQRGYPDQMFETPNLVWDKPLTLLIDQNSYSDGEIFPILFKQMGLGKVVGMPTSGAVIGTTPYRLMDGSTIRMPQEGWFTKDGINMEGTGATPDYLIDMTPEDIINNNDVQIQKAVELLLQQLSQK